MPLTLQLSTRTQWIDAGSWIAYTLFGGLLPFWGTALILLFVNRSQSLGRYLENGELAVFCAGLLASTIPVMRRRIKGAQVEHPGWFHFVALVALAVIFVLFASVTLARQFRASDLNMDAVIVTSLILFVVSVVMGFFVELIQNIRITSSEVKSFEESREVDLATGFDTLLKTSHD
jgi:NhaP-type Na+/H+ or K+/H+ antiporter